MSPRRLVAAALTALVPSALVAGCAVPGPAVGPGPAVPAGGREATPSPTTTTTHHPVGRDGAPSPFRVLTPGRELELGPSTYCTLRECVDGVDPDPPRIGGPEQLRVRVTERTFGDLTVHATDDVAPGGSFAEDADWSELPAEPLGDGVWLVRPDVPAGTYLVTLSARGDGTGDMVADLVWRIPGGGG